MDVSVRRDAAEKSRAAEAYSALMPAFDHTTPSLSIGPSFRADRRTWVRKVRHSSKHAVRLPPRARLVTRWQDPLTTVCASTDRRSGA
jgi:hypothetical protein